MRDLGLAFEGRKKRVFGFFAFFAKFRPASGDPGLGFGGPFWAPGGVFTAWGLEKRKKPKHFESRAKNHVGCYVLSDAILAGGQPPAASSHNNVSLAANLYGPVRGTTFLFRVLRAVADRSGQAADEHYRF